MHSIMVHSPFKTQMHETARQVMRMALFYLLGTTRVGVILCSALLCVLLALVMDFDAYFFDNSSRPMNRL